MANSPTLKAVVTSGGPVSSGSAPLRLALYNEDGTPLDLTGAGEGSTAKAEAQPDSEATTIKDLVSDLNGLLAKLRDAGLMES